MSTIIHQPHDKFFKANLKDKRVAIDYLKSALEPKLFAKIDITSLQLTEKSFITEPLQEIHGDIIYKCTINNSDGYLLFFLLEHQSTADPLMAFRFLHTTVSLSYQHTQQGYKKLPVILPICMYHGKTSPYPYSTSIYDCYEDPAFAEEVALKPFKLIDLTVLSDEELKTHGLAALMEMLFKHQKDKKFLAFFKMLLQLQEVQSIITELGDPYFKDMLNYVVVVGQDDSEPHATQHLIYELTQAFPQEKEVIMTFAQQLKQEGRREEALAIAHTMLEHGMSLATIQQLIRLSEEELRSLEEALPIL